MNKKIKNSIASIMLVAAVAVVFTSCNRGMGCPNNFSLEEVVPSIINGAEVFTID